MRAAVEVDDAVALGAPHQLGGILLRRAFDEDALHGADAAVADAAYVRLECGLQMLQSPQLDVVRRVVGEVGRRRARARAEDEAEACVEADVVDQRHQLREVVVALAGEADDEVARQADARAHRAQPADRALVLQRRVAALHRGEDAVAAVLHRQVHVVDELWQLRVGVDQPLRELVGVARRVADAIDARDLGDVLEQQREVGDVGRVTHPSAVGVDVLPEQRHFPDTLVGQPGDLGQHVVERAADLLAARVRHDAVAAILAAAFHDRDERARAVDPRRRQVVELLDLREADVDLWPLLAPARLDHLRQPVQRLRAEHEVHVRRALHDGLALLARDAAADADQHALLLQVLDAAEVAEHLLLRLLAHRAGVEQDQVRLLGVGRRLVAVGRAQHVGHLVRVVLVHLAAERADVDLLRCHRASRHGLVHFCAARLNDHACACCALVGHGSLATSSARSSHTSISSPVVASTV